MDDWIAPKLFRLISADCTEISYLHICLGKRVFMDIVRLDVKSSYRLVNVFFPYITVCAHISINRYLVAWYKLVFFCSNQQAKASAVDINGLYRNYHNIELCFLYILYHTSIFNRF